MHNPNPLVLNWHLTEACNYRCQYCYAAWKKSTCKRELIHDPERTASLLSKLYRFFQPGNLTNPLFGQMTWNSVRLNLAGGEPLLYADKLPDIVSQAKDIGFEVSLISNGSVLNHELLNQLVPDLTWLGISIDSANPATNRAIGRADRGGRMLNLNELATSLLVARESNPGLRIKINTVVNRHNYSEDLNSLIHSFAPEKWKVLRMLPVVDQQLTVSDEQFASFVARHSSFAGILCAEDNQDMRESYLMIDPYGRFFQNSQLIAGKGYAYSRPIIKVGAGEAFSEMNFDHERFNARYLPLNKKVVA